MKKNIWILAIIIIFAALMFLVLRSGVEAPTMAPEVTQEPTAEIPTTPTEPELGADEVQDIESQLEGIDLGDLESEFQDIDDELQQL